MTRRQNGQRTVGSEDGDTPFAEPQRPCGSKLLRAKPVPQGIPRKRDAFADEATFSEPPGTTPVGGDRKTENGEGWAGEIGAEGLGPYRSPSVEPDE